MTDWRDTVPTAHLMDKPPVPVPGDWVHAGFNSERCLWIHRPGIGREHGLDADLMGALWHSDGDFVRYHATTGRRAYLLSPDDEIDEWRLDVAGERVATSEELTDDLWWTVAEELAAFTDASTAIRDGETTDSDEQTETEEPTPTPSGETATLDDFATAGGSQ